MTTTPRTIALVPTHTFDGALQGAQHTEGLGWSFEGTVYDTPADEATVQDCVGEALAQPTQDLVSHMHRIMFKRGDVAYTSQVLLAMMRAYAEEVGGASGSDGSDAVCKLLQEAARRVAVIEALTM